MEKERLKKQIKALQSELARLEALDENTAFEVGSTYMTNWSAPEPFTITKIVTNKQGELVGFHGIYENSKHLGVSPLGYRLGRRLVKNPS